MDTKRIAFGINAAMGRLKGGHMEGKSRAAWEWPVLLVVVVAAVFLLGLTYKHQKDVGLQKNLRYQLGVMRSAEMLYKVVNKSNPENLKKLIEGTYQLPGEPQSRRYIDNPPKMVGGQLLDPFENAYAYNPANGWIKSTTPGYETW